MATTIRRSNRPGRRRALSRISGRLVAAMRMMPSFESKPSISTRSWLSVCSRSSWPPPSPAPRWRPTASISSMKMRQGACFLPWSKRSRTREAPTPTNISTKSEPLIEKNGTSASPATARASRVLPVPGAPTRRTPLGMRPPSFWNLCGSLRNSMISLELLLGLVDPGDVLERHLLGQPREELGPALAEGHGLVPPGLHLPHEEDPEEDEEDDREPAEEEGEPAVPGGVLDDDVDLVLAEDLDQVVVLGGQDRPERPAVLDISRGARCRRWWLPRRSPARPGP